MKARYILGFVGALLLALWTSPTAAYDVENYEEAGGGAISFWINPVDTLYGLSLDNSVWLRQTPIMATYFLATFWTGKEEAWYSGIGLTLRIMPHWRFAPYAGGGGSYNLSMMKGDQDDLDPEIDDWGESFWAWHAEGGLRITFPRKRSALELGFRYTWPSLDGDSREYWMGIISLVEGF